MRPPRHPGRRWRLCGPPDYPVARPHGGRPRGPRRWPFHPSPARARPSPPPSLPIPCRANRSAGRSSGRAAAFPCSRGPPAAPLTGLGCRSERAPPRDGRQGSSVWAPAGEPPHNPRTGCTQTAGATLARRQPGRREGARGKQGGGGRAAGRRAWAPAARAIVRSATDAAALGCASHATVTEQVDARGEVYSRTVASRPQGRASGRRDLVAALDGAGRVTGWTLGNLAGATGAAWVMGGRAFAVSTASEVAVYGLSAGARGYDATRVAVVSFGATVSLAPGPSALPSALLAATATGTSLFEAQGSTLVALPGGPSGLVANLGAVPSARSSTPRRRWNASAPGASASAPARSPGWTPPRPSARPSITSL